MRIQLNRSAVVTYSTMMTKDAKFRTRSVLTAPIVVLLAGLLSPGAVFAQDFGTLKASHTVEIGIRPITAIAVSANPAPLILSDQSGTWSDSWNADDSDSISDRSSTYRLTSNVRGAMIVAALDAPMPPDTQLSVRLESAIGISRGSVVFSSGDMDGIAVSDLQPGLENNRSIVLEFASAAGRPVPVQNRMLALTLIDPTSGRSDTAYQTVTFGASAGNTLADVR